MSSMKNAKMIIFSSCNVYYITDDFRQYNKSTLLLKSEANSEVHLTCIVYDVQQEATPLVFLSFFNIGSNVQCFWFLFPF